MNNGEVQETVAPARLPGSGPSSPTVLGGLRPRPSALARWAVCGSRRYGQESRPAKEKESKLCATAYIIDELLAVMVERDASDLHVTAGSPPVIRVNGRLERLTEHELLMPEETRTLLYRILSTEQQKILETRRQIDFSHSIPGLARFRVNTFFQRESVGAAFRMIPAEIKTLEQLGMPERLYELADKPRGLVLVTGPTGSGKSTTLASLLDHVNKTRHEHILTIEDPDRVPAPARLVHRQPA